tara:strand:+ start:1969 stop:2214 length:246 start_codon:yes stop_codon:yes gene_type:complete
MKTTKESRLINTIINGDHIDIDTLVELMVASNWSIDDIVLVLGDDIEEQALVVMKGLKKIKYDEYGDTKTETINEYGDKVS